ncbi:uncharacterized protein LOC142638468 [Castanea sativa]|uniref:uncharacterized protein LOC142638468 n=1 Tax=Castanea sativa TaxID=21020 RepID=UPI003F64C788
MAWGSPITDPDTIAIKETQKQLDRLNKAELTEASKAKFLSLSKRMDELLQKQEMYRAQRFRINWMKHGDRNTKFFHAKASQRRRKNYINGIRNSQWMWVENLKEVVEVASDYCDNLFQAGVGDQMEECLDAVESRVTDDMREFLSTQFTTKEVKVALFQMGPTKALGPDGMNAHFYQKYWHTVGDSVVSAVLNFFNNGNMLPNINHTNIVLIPKVQNSERMSEFRPINLCNVIYKIISKVLANRLKQVLPQIISPTQSAFVPGRLITDNVMVAYETLHTMHARKKGKKGYLALKLDISKAYDRIEWQFCKANWVEGKIIAEILQTYARASRQSINLEKSSAYFSSNTPERQKDHILEILRIKEVDRFVNYLGLPTLIGRAKYNTFSYLKDRIWKKLQGWKGMLLSRVSKEILIKAMAQSIPTYTMSVFQITLKLCNELDALCAKFWWGQIGNELKIHWKSWDKLTSSKKEGEMGFRDLRAFNLAVLAKQDLINPELDIWKYENIMAIFHRDEAEAICQIPLSRRNVPDSVFWLQNSRGLFTVKSAYHVAKRLLTDVNRSGSSRECAAKDVWTAIWKPRLPNKIKVFAWRACHEILPTAANLNRRKVITEDKCSVCTREMESTIHAL